jgi:hypothetical protein
VPAIYEAGDSRLAASINEFPADSFSVRFQNTNYFLAKYAAREDYNEPPGDVDLNYENNLRIFRYAETLLNAVELMEFLGEGMRFWDVVRWGDTHLLNDDLPDYSSERTWEASEIYLPIPQNAINSTIGSEFEIVQNPY